MTKPPGCDSASSTSEAPLVIDVRSVELMADTEMGMKTNLEYFDALLIQWASSRTGAAGPASG